MYNFVLMNVFFFAKFFLLIFVLAKSGYCQNARTDSYDYSLIIDDSLNVYSCGKYGQKGLISKTDSSNNTIWTKLIGTENDIVSIKSISIFQDSLLMVIGNITSDLGFGSSDLLIQQLNINGVTKFSYLFGTGSYESVRCFFIDEISNSIYVVFNSTKFNSINSNICLAKFSKNGNILWSKVYISDSEDIANDIFVDGSSILIGGNSTFNDDKDGLLIKTDLNGSILWTRKFGGLKSDEISSVLVNNGNSYVTGWSDSYGYGDKDVLILKIGINGNWKWGRIIGNWLIEKGSDIQLFNGSLVVVGYMQSTTGTVDDMMYSILDTNATKLSTFQIIKGNDNYGIYSKKYNNRILLGGLDLSNGWNFMIREANPAQNIDCDSTASALDFSATNVTTKIGLFSDSTITGSFNKMNYLSDYFIFDTTLLPLQICLIDKDSIIEIDTTGINKNSLDSIQIYPNPSNGLIQIVNPKFTFEYLLKIYDINGKIVHQEKITQKDFTLRLNLNHGIYFLKTPEYGTSLIIK